MSDSNLVAQFLSSCFRGALGVSECGPVWHFTLIGLLVLAGLAALVRLRLRAAKESHREHR
jgi:hypothetical protein